MFVLCSLWSKGQVTTSVSAGVANNSSGYVKVEVGYETYDKYYDEVPGKWVGKVGFAASLTNDVKVPDFVFIKGGRNFILNDETVVSVQGGGAVRSYSREVYEGTDPLYSYWKKTRKINYVLSVDYSKQVIRNGYVYGEGFVAGNTLILSIGLKFKF